MTIYFFFFSPHQLSLLPFLLPFPCLTQRVVIYLLLVYTNPPATASSVLLIIFFFFFFLLPSPAQIFRKRVFLFPCSSSFPSLTPVMIRHAFRGTLPYFTPFLLSPLSCSLFLIWPRSQQKYSPLPLIDFSFFLPFFAATFYTCPPPQTNTPPFPYLVLWKFPSPTADVPLSDFLTLPLLPPSI